MYSHLNEKEQDIYARFFAYGLTGVVVDWAMKGMKEDADQLTDLLQHMIFHTEKLGYEIYMYRKKEEQNENKI